MSANFPPHIVLIEDWITEEEEQKLLENIPRNTFKPTQARNSIARYGSDVPYGNKMISQIIPEWMKPLLEKEDSLKATDQVTINEYFPGQGISYHVDSEESGEVISVVSLLSDSTILLKRYKHPIVEIELPRRSLLQMSGETRWKWEHAIAPLKEERISIVFRTSNIKDKL